jgi:hypothetical protein
VKIYNPYKTADKITVNSWLFMLMERRKLKATNNPNIWKCYLCAYNPENHSIIAYIGQ